MKRFISLSLSILMILSVMLSAVSCDEMINELLKDPSSVIDTAIPDIPTNSEDSTVIETDSAGMTVDFGTTDLYTETDIEKPWHDTWDTGKPFETTSPWHDTWNTGEPFDTTNSGDYTWNTETETIPENNDEYNKDVEYVNKTLDYLKEFYGLTYETPDDFELLRYYGVGKHRINIEWYCEMMYGDGVYIDEKNSKYMLLKVPNNNYEDIQYRLIAVVSGEFVTEEITFERIVPKIPEWQDEEFIFTPEQDVNDGYFALNDSF